MVRYGLSRIVSVLSSRSFGWLHRGSSQCIHVEETHNHLLQCVEGLNGIAVAHSFSTTAGVSRKSASTEPAPWCVVWVIDTCPSQSRIARVSMPSLASL